MDFTVQQNTFLNHSKNLEKLKAQVFFENFNKKYIENFGVINNGKLGPR